MVEIKVREHRRLTAGISVTKEEMRAFKKEAKRLKTSVSNYLRARLEMEA
jgi:hypothetical protein